MKRRNFLQHIIAGSTALTLPKLPLAQSEPLNILILGGTVFVGPAIVNEALSRGHRVTLLNRGISDPQIFDSLPLLKADRLAGASAYDEARQEKWDVIIDVWPEKSSLVEEAVATLRESSKFYLFISSIAVYADFSEIGITENSNRLNPGPDPATWYYGEEKVMAERAVNLAFPTNSAILRPGPIKGWRDPAGDLLYWLLRLRDYQQILGPGAGNDPLQFVDVKDVASLAIQIIERQHTGTFNVTGPIFEPLLWKDFLAIAARTLKSSAEVIYTDIEFIRSQQVHAFEDLPLWAPLDEDPGFMQIRSNKMQSIGAGFRPIEETLLDCLAWNSTSNVEQTGLSRNKEEEVIAAWLKE